MSTALRSTTPTIRRRMVDAYPLKTRPERRVYRVGSPYMFRHPSESLAVAACAFLTSNYRAVHGRVQRFSVPFLAAGVNASQNRTEVAWDRLLSYLVEVGVPSEPAPRRPEDPFLPLQLLTCESYEDVVSALADVGPVLMWLPWSKNYDLTSRAYGQEWVGADGTDTRGVYSHEWRGVLIKGVAWKFRGVCIQDGERPDLWMSFSEVRRLLSDGARAVAAVY